jgi:hypothetical protein
MKRKIFLLLIVLSLIALMSVSCKSTPKEAPPVVLKEDPMVMAARAKMNQARKQALDFESDKYFPGEWEVTEGLHKLIGTTGNDPSKFNALTDAYNSLSNKAVPLYAQAKEDELMALRAQIIATGFADAFPQYLKNADDLALAAKEKYDAKDYYGAKDAADVALNEYNTLLAGANVYITRQEIINRGFTQYDSDNFVKSDEIAQKAIDAYNAGDKAAALASAEEAQLRYNIVLSNGWTTYAAERKEAAEKERQSAVANRANIASKETFRSGDSSFEEANEFYSAENYSEAALAFVEAEAIFSVSKKETEEKRVRAEEAIRVAEEKIEESSGSALEAEKLIEGGSK